MLFIFALWYRLQNWSGCSVARYRASMGCWRSWVRIPPSRRKLESSNQLVRAFLVILTPSVWRYKWEKHHLCQMWQKTVGFWQNNISRVAHICYIRITSYYKPWAFAHYLLSLSIKKNHILPLWQKVCFDGYVKAFGVLYFLLNHFSIKTRSNHLQNFFLQEVSKLKSLRLTQIFSHNQTGLKFTFFNTF